jgi:hypothetical protein
MTRSRKVLVSVAGSIVTLYFGALMLLGWFMGASNCDDACNVQSTDWWDHEGAWQWLAVAGLPLLTFAGVVVAWVLAAQGRFRAMLVPVAAAAVCFGLWVALTHQGHMGLYR